MSSIHSTNTVPAGHAATVLVPGQQGESVNVQSQLATSNVQGDIVHNSNIAQVIDDLSASRTAATLWVDAETAKVHAWGQGEINRILGITKQTEEQLVAGARQKQQALDAQHSAELQKLVQQIDLQKAAELKELEDGLQRQIQAILTSSKSDINGVESQMNARRMELLKQSQLRSAKEIDALSNLVVETKLVPSQTRTVIETRTDTAPVIAVATGGNISTGSASAETHSSARIAAVPVGGVVAQGVDVSVGTLRRDTDNVKVGDAAIVNTMTTVSQGSKHADAAYGAGKSDPLVQREITSTQATSNI